MTTPGCQSTPGIGNQLGCNPPGYVPSTPPPPTEPTTTTTLLIAGDDCMEGGLTRWSLQPCTQVQTQAVVQVLPATGIDLSAPIAGGGISLILAGIALLKLAKHR